jgi:hypothetical protein
MAPFEKLRELWSQGKDFGAAVVAKHQINKQLAPFGNMLRLNIDSTRKSVEMEMLLKGETHPIIISIDEYLVEEDATGLSIVIKRVSTSREWMTTAAQKFLVDRKFPLGREYAALLKLVI